MSDCLFCKIIAKEIPCFNVYEDEDVLAFLDINPVNPGHTLVIPKKHFENFSAIPEKEVLKTILAVKKITPAVLAGVKASDFNLNLNNGGKSGQLINHLHWHIIPRFENDGHSLWRGKSYPEGEAEKVLQSIKNNIT